MNNMFKKIICLALALSMCVGMVAFANEAAEATEVTEEAVADQAAIEEALKKIDPSILAAMEFLRGFGIIADYYETNVNVNEYITRADFSDALAKLMNLTLKDRTDTYFYDVSPSHFANPAISALTEMNLVNGVGDNCFEPDELIETAAACKVLLSVLGYDERAKYEGGYPTGYLKVAKRLELIENDYTDEYLKRGDMFILLLNAIKTPMFIPVSFSDTKGNLYQIDEDETILSQYYDAFYAEGVVEGANMMSVNGTDLGEETYVEISGVVYNSEIDLSGMIGEKVNFIAREADGAEDATVFWAESAGISNVSYISAKQFAGFDSANYELSYYTEDGKKETKKLSRDLSLVYNGGLIERNLSAILDTPCDLKIVENNKSCVVIAKKKASFVVNSVDVSGEVIANYIAGGNAIDLNTENREYVVIKDAAGKKISISDLAIGDVLMVYESQYELPATYGDYLEIVVGKTVVTGNIDKIRDTELGEVVTIGELEYRNISGQELTLGKKTTAYIDGEGDLVYATLVSEKDFAAFVVAVGYEKGAFENKTFLRLFKQDGTFATYEVAEDVIIDGEKKESDDLYAITTDADGIVEPQIALVKLDKDGKIAYFDTPSLKSAFEGDGTIRPSTDVAGKNFMYKTNGYLMDYWNLADASSIAIGTHAFNASTVIFRTPPAADIKAGTTEDDQYGLGWGSYARENYTIRENDGTVVGLYKTSDRVASAEEFIIIEGYGKTSSTKYPILVESTGVVIDDEGVPQDVIIGYDGNSTTTRVLADEVVFYNRVGKDLPIIKSGLMAVSYEGAEMPDYTLADIKRGMVVEIEVNKLNEGTGVAVIYDPEASAQDNFYKTMPNAAASEVGIALDVDVAKNILALQVPRSDYSETIKNLKQVIKVGGAQILVYDGEQDRNNIYPGTLADIRTTRTSPGNETTILVFSNQTTIERIYIFK